jgi:hypothetical protein
MATCHDSLAAAESFVIDSKLTASGAYEPEDTAGEAPAVPTGSVSALPLLRAAAASHAPITARWSASATGGWERPAGSLASEAQSSSTTCKHNSASTPPPRLLRARLVALVGMGKGSPNAAFFSSSSSTSEPAAGVLTAQTPSAALPSLRKPTVPLYSRLALDVDEERDRKRPDPVRLIETAGGAPEDAERTAASI